MAVFLAAIGLLVTGLLLTHGTWQDLAAAQGDTTGANPTKAMSQAAGPQTLLPNDTYFASQALVFVPLSSSLTYHGGQAGCRTSDGVGDYFAPVDIPHGSMVDALEVVYYNSVPTSQSAFVSLAMGTDLGGWQTLSPLNFSNKTSGYHLLSVTANHEINTYNNSYSLYWYSGGSDMQLCQVRLYYRPPVLTLTYLPLISK